MKTPDQPIAGFYCSVGGNCGPFRLMCQDAWVNLWQDHINPTNSDRPRCHGAFNFPGGLDAILEGYSELADPNCPPSLPDGNRQLNPGWERAESGQPDSFPPGSPAESPRIDLLIGSQPGSITRTNLLIVQKEDGAVKVIQSGHALVERNLDRLDSPELARMVMDFFTATKSLAEAEAEKAKLEKEIHDLRQLVAFTPGAIEYRIRREFGVTTGQNVDIVSCDLDDGPYNLVVDGKQTRAVDKKFGQAIKAEQICLDLNRARMNEAISRQGELDGEITCLRRAIPSLRQGVGFYLGRLNRGELNRRLGGDFVSFGLSNQGDAIALVRKEVDETKISDETKRRLLALCLLTGLKLPEDILKALGIEAAVDAVTNALNPAPELKASEETPKPAVPKVAKPAARKARPTAN